MSWQADRFESRLLRCECGRPALYRSPSWKTQAAGKDHPLCRRCYNALLNRIRLRVANTIDPTMTPDCATCQDNGHDPDAPWFLCPSGCAAAARIRLRSGEPDPGPAVPLVDALHPREAR